MAALLPLPLENDVAFAADAGEPIRGRHVDVGARHGATQQPRGEGDQALVGGWPMYRTSRSQEAFNEAMATLVATEGEAPREKDFGGCSKLECHLTLPAIGEDGWMQPGRIWISPDEYMIVAKSPRNAEGKPFKRRDFRSMRIFVYHEYQNSNFNTDTFDTISAHSRAIFVPFYLSKEMTDAKGRRFVFLVQTAPYDVVSRHASNMGSAGPGIEVAKNTNEQLEPLQGLAGIVVAAMVKGVAPHLKVVHHRNVEGLPMLKGWERRLALLRARPNAPKVELPFVPAEEAKLASAGAADLAALMVRPGESAPLAVAERSFVPKRAAIEEPRLIGPIRLVSRPPALAEPVLVGPVKLAVRPAKVAGGVER